MFEHTQIFVDISCFDIYISFADTHGKDLATVVEFDCLRPSASLQDMMFNSTNRDNNNNNSNHSPDTSDSDDSEFGNNHNNNNGSNNCLECAMFDRDQMCSYHAMKNCNPSLATSIRLRRVPSLGLTFLFAIMPRRDLAHVPVALTAVHFDSSASSLLGDVSVQNSAYEKQVFIRYSFDNWATCNEVSADFHSSACASNSRDLFKFVLPIPRVGLPVGGRLSFAIRFVCGGQEHWENNNGDNFQAICTVSRTTSLPRNASIPITAIISPPESPTLITDGRRMIMTTGRISPPITPPQKQHRTMSCPPILSSSEDGKNEEELCHSSSDLSSGELSPPPFPLSSSLASARSPPPPTRHGLRVQKSSSAPIIRPLRRPDDIPMQRGQSLFGFEQFGLDEFSYIHVFGDGEAAPSSTPLKHHYQPRSIGVPYYPIARHVTEELSHHEFMNNNTTTSLPNWVNGCHSNAMVVNPQVNLSSPTTRYIAAQLHQHHSPLSSFAAMDPSSGSSSSSSCPSAPNAKLGTSPDRTSSLHLAMASAEVA